MICTVLMTRQVLACDPEDLVIADAASAKSGLSVMVELGNASSSLDVYEPPKVLLLAFFASGVDLVHPNTRLDPGGSLRMKGPHVCFWS